MIKEYNYYITTNRFSQIAEELDSAVRSYADSIGKDAEKELREKARQLCSEHLVKSGIRNKNNSFINIDAEFFEGGELVEANLNRFIKDVLKAHGYQKILWEYMGTTGMMTEISKAAMQEDGFNYENYLPAELREKEASRKSFRLNRNFNRLKDDSGFDWGKGYDPNDTIKKNGWYSDYDINGVWTRFTEDDEKRHGERKEKSIKKYVIRLIKTQNGCLLYDPDMILLNPILLWYLNQEQEVYGAEESNTALIVEEIHSQIKRLGAEKITEIAFNGAKLEAGSETGRKEEYIKILGNLASENVSLISRNEAERKIALNEENEKSAVIEKENGVLQKKIDALVFLKPDCTAEEIAEALQTGKTKMPLDIIEQEDAALAGLTEEEYETFISLASRLQEEKRSDFTAVCAALSSAWKEYKSCGRTKQDCFTCLFDFVNEEKEGSFSYELPLSQVLEVKNGNNERPASLESIERLVKELLPEENQGAAQEYIASLPEQSPEIKVEVYQALEEAVKNYLAIRMSCGMSIRELFDYAVKKNGGKLPKSSFTPPTVGYINQNASARRNGDAGNKRVYFERTVSALMEELKKGPQPQKDVPLSQLEDAYERILANKKLPIVKIGRTFASGGSSSGTDPIIYDTGDNTGINPMIASLLRLVQVSDEKTKVRITELAAKSSSEEEFINSLKKEFLLEYSLGETEACQAYTLGKPEGLGNYLEEYAQDIKEHAEKTVADGENVSKTNTEIVPVFTQITTKNQNEDSVSAGLEFEEDKVQLPDGLSWMTHKRSAGGIPEAITPIPLRKYSEKNFANNSHSLKDSPAKMEDLDQKEEKKSVEQLLDGLSQPEREELLHSVGEGPETITPLLIKEYLWRKQNGRKISSIARDVQGYERLAQLPHEKLERFLTSSAVHGRAKTVCFDHKTLSFGESVSISEKLSLNTVDSTDSATAFMPETYIPVVKLSSEEKSHFLNDYGIRAEGLSPVVREYIRSGEWKNGAGNGGSTDGSYNDQTRNHSNVKTVGQTVKIKGTAERKAAESNADAIPGTEKPEPPIMSAALKSSLTRLAQGRNPRNPETMTKLDRINANYEHDKAILAKSEPLFAKNQFWDVGHAEESGELSSRDKDKSIQDGFNQKVDEILNGGI